MALRIAMLTACTMACSSSSGAGVGGLEDADFFGFVVSVDAGAGRLGLESHAQKVVRRVVVLVTPDTLVVRSEGGRERKVSLADVGSGQWVKVWFAGPEVAPGEVAARKIAVLQQP